MSEPKMSMKEALQMAALEISTMPEEEFRKRLEDAKYSDLAATFRELFALPPEPGKLEEEAKARKYTEELFQATERDWPCYGEDIKDAWIAGARSRDALLASQGERIKELETRLEHLPTVPQFDRMKGEVSTHLAQAMSYQKENDSLRAALEQLKAERDELEKKLEQQANDRLDGEWPVVKQLSAASSRIASLEEGLREIANAPSFAYWLPGQGFQASGGGVGIDAGYADMARALLAAGEKAGGENEG